MRALLGRQRLKPTKRQSESGPTLGEVYNGGERLLRICPACRFSKRPRAVVHLDIGLLLGQFGRGRCIANVQRAIHCPDCGSNVKLALAPRKQREVA